MFAWRVALRCSCNYRTSKRSISNATAQATKKAPNLTSGLFYGVAGGIAALTLGMGDRKATHSEGRLPTTCHSHSKRTWTPGETGEWVVYPKDDKSSSVLAVVRDPELLSTKIVKMVAEGPSKLQVITDYDFTITKFFLANGERGPSCHSAVITILDDQCQQQAEGFRSYYYPIEISNMPVRDKIPLMIEWAERSHQLMKTCGLTHDKLRRAIASTPIPFRPGVNDFFSLLREAKVPVLVFSAGVGNVIEESFDQLVDEEIMRCSDVHVVSNYITFGQDGTIKHFSHPVLHGFNKKAAAAQHSPFFKDIFYRHNLILMGDSLGDLNMSQGVACDTIIRIGFLNNQIEERIDDFLKAFDVVIVGDGDFGFVNSLIQTIVNGSA